MGFTHYWYRAKELPRDAFERAVKDIRETLPLIYAAGVKLAGSHGTGPSVVTNDLISFNGLETCGHPKEDLGVTWSADVSGGVGGPEDAAAGKWFAGATLARRRCGGRCSHETFYVPRILVPERWDHPKEDGSYFQFCKTAFKPYDLAVTACLIILRHHLDGSFRVRSDGEEKDWFDAKLAVKTALGYGMDFELDQEG